MNTNMIASLVIGGLLLMAIVAMNINLSLSSAHLTMSQISQQNISTVTDLLTFDIPKIGYVSPGFASYPITSPFSVADSNKITFSSDVNNDGSVETVTWHFDESGTAPQLSRTVDATVTAFTVVVTDFDFIYRDKNLDTLLVPVSDFSQIRQINVEIAVRSKEKLGSLNNPDGEYIKTFWQKTFTPKNLTF